MKTFNKNELLDSSKNITFNINQVARIIDVVPTTIRNWEKAGLFVARRGGNNYRIFDFNDFELLKKIKQYSTEENMNMALIKKIIDQDTLSSKPIKKTYLKEFYHGKLKDYREKNSYTLEDVSSLTSISSSYLSRIEQGQVSVSLDILEKLTNLYGESLLTFFEVKAQEENKVCRFGNGTLMTNNLSGVETRALSNNSSTFSPVMFTVAPGSGDFHSHFHPSGQDFIYIVIGKLELTLNDVEIHILRTGDSIYFSSQQMHNWHNAGKTTLKMIWTHSSL